MNVGAYFDSLGRKAEDRVTGGTGVVTSVSFDLYGCVMVVLTPKVDEKGNRPESHWIDYRRLVIDTTSERVMTPPVFDFSAPRVVSPGLERGPAEKPSFDQLPPL